MVKVLGIPNDFSPFITPLIEKPKPKPKPKKE